MKTRQTFDFSFVDTLMTGFVVCALALVGGVLLVIQTAPVLA